MDDSPHIGFSVRQVSFILCAVVLTRLPFLLNGYGADPDAWLVAHSASMLWNVGIYHESRLPGYPLHEIISAPFVGVGGALWSNTSALVATLIAVFIWQRIVQRRTRHPHLLIICFAFAPVLWQHSAETLDYVWSLLFILGSLLAALNRRVLLSGLLLGIAAGFRPSNSIAFIPLVTFLYLERVSARKLFSFLLVAACTATAAFLPLMMKYGGPLEWLHATQFEMSDVHQNLVARVQAFLYRSVYFAGPAALGVGAFILWKGKSVFRKALRARHSVLVASLLGIAIFLLLFFSIPLERAYMLPALPFVLLVIDQLASRMMLTVFTVAFVFHGFVNFDVVKREGEVQSFGLNVHEGMVIEELKNRANLLDERRGLSSHPFREKSVIMTGNGSAFWFENPLVEPASLTDELKTIQTRIENNPHFRVVQQKGNPQVVFLPHLLKSELSFLRQSGYDCYCIRGAKRYLELLLGFDLEQEGVRILIP